jgi:predicted kinase
MITMEILIGLIASGKSTYAKRRAKEGAIVVCDDSIVSAVHANDYTLYKPELKVLYKSIENLIIGLGTALGRDIIIDSGRNVSGSARKRWIAIARSLDLHCKATMFPRANIEVHAMRRFESDHRGHTLEYWIDVVKKHNEVYTIPYRTEGFDEITWEGV